MGNIFLPESILVIPRDQLKKETWQKISHMYMIIGASSICFIVYHGHVKS